MVEIEFQTKQNTKKKRKHFYQKSYTNLKSNCLLISCGAIQHTLNRNELDVI